jgi:hypothetical protein
MGGATREEIMTTNLYAIVHAQDTSLLWYGEASEDGEAFDKYFADAGVDADDEYEMLDAITLIELSEDEYREVNAWWKGGAHSNEYPDCLKTGCSR